MARYRMLTGRFGRSEGGRNVTYTAGDEFEADGDLSRLVNAGIAERVEDNPAPPPEKAASSTADDPGGGTSRWPDGLNARTRSALEDAGVTPDDVASLSDDDLLAVDGVGPASVTALRDR